MMESEEIIRALRRLSELLGERDIEGEICLLGGTVMVLAFHARPSTKDVDAIFVPAAPIRELARVVQEEQNLPDGWLNDGAKFFVSAKHETVSGDLPQFESLRLTMPTPEYMLAMKCMASRIGGPSEERGDIADIRFLIKRLNLKTSDDVLAIVAKYYPPGGIPARARFLIEDIFARVEGES
jgi:hypothetical protein